MRRRWLAAVALIGALLMAGTAGASEESQNRSLAEIAQRASAAFDEGVRLRDQDPEQSRRALRNAVTHYERLLDAGVAGGPLLYNLGNAHALLDEVGPAMLAYRRAELFMPHDPNLTANIDMLRSRIATRSDSSSTAAPPARIRSLLRGLPETLTTGVALVAWLALWTSLIAGRFTRRSFGAASIIALIIVVFSSALLAGSVWAGRTDQRAVIIAPETIGRKGPDANAYAPSFSAPLPGGSEVTIVTERPDWTLVRLNDGRETWIPAPDVTRIQSIF